MTIRNHVTNFNKKPDYIRDKKWNVFISGWLLNEVIIKHIASARQTKYN